MNPESLKKKNILYQNFTDELEQMAITDQTVMSGGADADSLLKNTERLKEIITEIGFPTRTTVGSAGAENAWLIAQHADHDPEFQMHCLILMKQTPPDEIERQNIAYLEDRVRVNQGKPQLYGTQFVQENNTQAPQPIEDIENVDARRSEMGMGPLEDYVELMNARNSPKEET